MKALILAAGFGTRLKPYTEQVPKPLFTIDNRPLIDHTIRKLEKAGVTRIEINTHHLSDQIEDFVRSNNYSADINVVYEEKILETGGSIRNALSGRDEDLLVVNGDIFFEFDLKDLIDSHEKSKFATLLLHDYKRFNSIETDGSLITKFRSDNKNTLAFTGIHLVSKEVLNFIPENEKISITDIYIDMIENGHPVNCIKRELKWIDIGEPENYRTASLFNLIKEDSIIKEIDGDGSDRRWFRVKEDDKDYILSDHGIDTSKSVRQVESFVAIGKHLFEKGVNVPEIFRYDYMSGLVLVEDLGSIHLADYAKSENKDILSNLYKKVIDKLLLMSFEGINDFNTDLCYQSRSYDRDLIVNNECLYFLNEFVSGYCGIKSDSTEFITESELLSEKILEGMVPGLMHRDFQSKNIMIKNETPFFIDFQGARKGPVEYDLASLLIDPYVDLKNDTKDQLVSYFKKVCYEAGHDLSDFDQRYRLCRVARNLQMLGAFSKLALKDGKVKFEKYIPTALRNLKIHIDECGLDLIVLKGLVEECSEIIFKKE